MEEVPKAEEPQQAQSQPAEEPKKAEAKKAETVKAEEKPTTSEGKKDTKAAEGKKTTASASSPPAGPLQPGAQPKREGSAEACGKDIGQGRRTQEEAAATWTSPTAWPHHHQRPKPPPRKPQRERRAKAEARRAPSRESSFVFAIW